MNTTLPQPSAVVWEYSLTRKKALEIREDETAQRPEDIARFLRGINLQEKEQEHFLAIILDVKHHIKGFYTVSIGLLDRSPVHSREVFRHSIIQGASVIVLAHNHPSGDPTPSAQDISSTRSVVEAGKIVGIEVLDHVIIGLPSPSRPRDYLSFREEGLM